MCVCVCSLQAQGCIRFKGHQRCHGTDLGPSRISWRRWWCHRVFRVSVWLSSTAAAQLLVKGLMRWTESNLWLFLLNSNCTHIDKPTDYWRSECHWYTNVCFGKKIMKLLFYVIWRIRVLYIKAPFNDFTFSNQIQCKNNYGWVSQAFPYISIDLILTRSGALGETRSGVTNDSAQFKFTINWQQSTLSYLNLSLFFTVCYSEYNLIHF